MAIDRLSAGLFFCYLYQGSVKLTFGVREVYENLNCLELVDLVKNCWHKDPKVRPSFDTVVIELRRIASTISGLGLVLS